MNDEPSPQDRTRLSYWFPRVAAAGLPVPRTRLVPLVGDEPTQLFTMFDGETPACLARITDAIADAATDLGGPPCFLRTDFMSGKHEWVDTCYVSDLARLPHHLYGLLEYAEMADMFGPRTDLFAVRELLWTRPAFYAFNQMPITREFRIFIRNGTVEHLQPYWPPESIYFRAGTPEPPTWREDLARLSAIDAETRATLMALSVRASAALPGFWSMDWLETVHDGWMLTDCADGDLSFRWEGLAS